MDDTEIETDTFGRSTFVMADDRSLFCGTISRPLKAAIQMAHGQDVTRLEVLYALGH